MQYWPAGQVFLLASIPSVFIQKNRSTSFLINVTCRCTFGEMVVWLPPSSKSWWMCPGVQEKPFAIGQCDLGIGNPYRPAGHKTELQKTVGIKKNQLRSFLFFFALFLCNHNAPSVIRSAHVFCYHCMYGQSASRLPK